MDVFALVAAFGGGIIGAYMGALPAFIMTGIVTIGGAITAMAGAADVSLGFIAFGSFLGPHIAFAGGVAAAAYAGKKKKLENGADLVSSLHGLADPMTIVVGGIFGILGFIAHYIYGTVLHFNTDLPGITVITTAIIARLVFGSSGLFGKFPEGENRSYFSKGKMFYCNVVLGLGLGTAIGFTYKVMANSGVSNVALANYPLLCFGIAATTLIFTQTGFATPATHHIALPAALAVAATGNPIMAVIFGILGALLGDFLCCTFNTNTDSHIDPPAFTIFILTFAVNILFGNGFLSV